MEDGLGDESYAGATGSVRSKIPPGHFAQDIQLMMFGFGDVAKPLLESANLVEKVVRQQLITLIEAAATVAQQRGSKSIGTEEFLFLFRRDKDKLHRLLQYLKSKDLKSVAMRDIDDGVPDALDDPKEGSRWKGGKRMKLSRQFLAALDPSDELAAVVDRAGTDAVKLERMQRADIASRKMDVVQYMHFNQARSTNFGRDPAKMRDWLAECSSIHSVFSGSDETYPKISQGAFELVAYIVYETVAQIVDLALLVKQDKRHDPDLLARLTPFHCRGSLDAAAPAQSGVVASSGGSMLAPAGTAAAAATVASSAQFVADQLDAASTLQQHRGSSPAASSGSSSAGGGGASAGSAASAVGRKRHLNDTDSAIQPHEIREAIRRYQLGAAMHSASPLGSRSSSASAASFVS